MYARINCQGIGELLQMNPLPPRRYLICGNGCYKKQKDWCLQCIGWNEAQACQTAREFAIADELTEIDDILMRRPEHNNDYLGAIYRASARINKLTKQLTQKEEPCQKK